MGKTIFDDSEPAFPRPESKRSDLNYEHAQIGMSLRDYFAGQALIAVYAAYERGNRPSVGTDHILRNVPAHAYAMADAMLKAREGK